MSRELFTRFNKISIYAELLKKYYWKSVPLWANKDIFAIFHS